MSIDDELNNILGSFGGDARIRQIVEKFAEAKKIIDETMPMGGELEKTYTLMTVALKLMQEETAPNLPAFTATVSSLRKLTCQYLSNPHFRQGRPVGLCRANADKNSPCSDLECAFSLAFNKSPESCVRYAVRQEMERENAAS